VAVDAVEPAQGGVPALGVQALDARLLGDQQGVVVPLDAVVLELAGAVQERGDRGDAVVAEERDAGALGVVPRELVPADQPGDLVAVALGVEGADVVADLVAAWWAEAKEPSLTRPSP
jgi:hypothetical protein